MAYNDPIVHEVRKSRELILKQLGGNLDDFFNFIRDEEHKNPERIAKIITPKGNNKARK